MKPLENNSIISFEKSFEHDKRYERRQRRKHKLTLPLCSSRSPSFRLWYNQSILLKNKIILVTGTDGFIGLHLTEALVKKNAKADKIKIGH
jgi:FlaA1/EpsC-like NDP-sugar epimerase